MQPFSDSYTRLLPNNLRTSPWVVTSRSLFVEAYIYYASILLFSYLVLCFSEPVYKLVFGTGSVGANSTSTFDPESGTWPLTVALLIVGLSPNFPVLRDAEQLFRRFSRRSAGIPRNFVATLHRVRGLQLQSQDTSGAYAKDIQEVMLILSVYWAISGKSRPAHATLARNAGRSLLLYNWTVSPDTSIQWSPQALEKISFFEQRLVQDLRTARDAALQILSIDETDKFHTKIEDTVGQGFSYDDRENEELAAYWRAHEAELTPILEPASEAAQIFAEQVANLETAFSLLVTHDNLTRKIDDPTLKRTLQHLFSFQSFHTRHLILVGTATATIVSFLLASALFIGNPWICDLPSAGKDHGETFRSAIGDSTRYLLGFLVVFLTGTLGALFYHKVKDVEERGGIHGGSFSPNAHRISLFVMAYIFAAIGMCALWIVYIYPDSPGINAFYRDFTREIDSNLVETIPGAIFGGTFVILLGKCSSGAETPLHLTSKASLVWHTTLTGLCSAGLTVIAYILLLPEIGDGIWRICAQNSKHVQIALAGATPVIVLWVLIPQMRSISRLRQEPHA